MGKIITFTSDFGWTGPYIAAVKGVIKSIAPDAEIIDVTHDIEPADVLGAGLALASAAPFFPDGTVHLAVVDPGVGTNRRIIAARLDSHLFVAPDNGLLARVHERAADRTVVVLTQSRYWRENISPTFHARDIMGPVAAHLALDVTLEELGDPTHEIVHDGWEPACVLPAGAIRGKVVAVDRFGNCITNIRECDLAALAHAGGIVLARGRTVPLARTFADVPLDDPVAYLGSAGFLEIAVNQGSAADLLHLEKDETITLRPD